MVAYLNLSKLASFPFMGILPTIAAVADKASGLGFSMKEPPASRWRLGGTEVCHSSAANTCSKNGRARLVAVLGV